ncbi:MAG TPA: acetyl-CoA hydrolase/transferase C-terminal domain-containing protein [Syntrophomonadaceae bacterium]|nr:acetyl-CoA hydrolase/transferase C-terminal domain-containing protein [Syntrophomonadaceae bacterium]HRX21525.1 acetyl-CoA hydrolase/transferase C-terminal domain-containing protein [Syntrophomonadaceae bacterium]
MDLKEMYKKRLMSAEQAVKMVKNNTEVWIGIAVPVPLALVDALVAREPEVENISINHIVDIHPQNTWRKLGRETNIRVDCGYPSVSRELVVSGEFTMTPNRFCELPKIYTDENFRPMHVAMVLVTPMDKHGYFCLGVGADATLAIAKNAAKKRREGDDRYMVLAQVNNQVPRSRGMNYLHISEITALVEQDQDLAVLPDTPPMTPEEELIGRYCAEFVKDGSTIQLGIGSIPNAVAQAFLDTHVQDLGVHSEMACDTMINLWEAEIITNRRKTFMPYRSIFTFAMGTRKLYDWIDDNPGVEFYPVDFVNNPHNIGKNDNLVSINACLQVDLTGQICSESMGYKQYTHPGGQLDFVDGAFQSKGGVSIIATTSTATPRSSGGQMISKIAPQITPGGIITTPRSCADYVITEYGTAKIKGQSVRQRVRNIISVAHPDFRDELEFEARRRNLI